MHHTNSHSARGKWEATWDEAAQERTALVADFNAWLVKTRIETEKTLLSRERHQRDIAPFAHASLEEANSVDDVTAVVVEFASITLSVMELKRKLALLNTYYRQAANRECDTDLVIEEGMEAEVNDLWGWFLDERKR